MNNELIYLDTNIYIDYFENRSDRLRPLGEFAFNLIKKALNCEYKIIVSSLVMDELDFKGFENKITDLMNSLRIMKKLIYIQETLEEIRISQKIQNQRRTPLNDTRHAVLANKYKANYFVTRNIKDFLELQDLIFLKFPENL